MKKKRISALIISIGAIYAISQANIVLNFPDIKTSQENNFSSVHFIAPGNNFVGSIFWLPTTSVTPTTITLSWSQKICTKLVRGIYFNSQRGKRLRPLDNETLQLLEDQNSSYAGLQLSWGLYTTCDSGSNYGIFWAITYTRWGKTSYLVAGTKLNYQANTLLPHMANSFQYFDNKVPMGYIYDSNGGIGYVGGMLTGHEGLINFLNNGGRIQSGFTYSGDAIVSADAWRETIGDVWVSAMETMRDMIIQGSVGLSKSIDTQERNSLIGNLQTKTIIYNGSDINSSTLINIAKQKATSLCQWQETNPNIATSDQTILCYENQDVTIDLTQTYYANKTIIVKNGNVILQGGMQQNSPSLDLFIDKWICYLPADPIQRQNFNDQGFPTSPGTSSWLYLKGNFIINGLLAGNGLLPFTHKLHLQGKITMLNTPLLPSDGRISQIEELLGSSAYNDTINLQNIFTRTCGLSGTGSDETSCIGSGNISSTPLVILNGSYPSNILQ